MIPQLMSVRNAAEQYGIAESTLRRWMATGKVETVKIGPRLVRIPIASLQGLVMPRVTNTPEGTR